MGLLASVDAASAMNAVCRRMVAKGRLHPYLERAGKRTLSANGAQWENDGV